MLMVNFVALRARSRLLAKEVALKNFARWLPGWLVVRLVARSDILDAQWVLQCAGVVPGDGRGAWAYRLLAAKSLAAMPDHMASPNPLFDVNWYRLRYGLRATALEAIVHYVLIGDRLGLRPHPWFDAAFYRRTYGGRLWLRSALGSFLGGWRRTPLGHPLFDPQWYLAAYEDVAAADVNPLHHFAEHGLAEGRRPNEFFDPQWYLRQNQDVAATGMPAAYHFAGFGAMERRNPGPTFNPRAYEAKYLSVSAPSEERQLDPLSHFLVFGRARGAVIDAKGMSVTALITNPDGCRPREDGDLAPDAPDAPAPRIPVIDVVIPVYRGLAETRSCIESVLRSRNRSTIRLRLHNDASPEPEVTSYLRSIADAHPDVLLVENPTNLGFVGTVNDAMRRAIAEPDFQAVVLLNSDTEVANDWVDRLLAHTLDPDRDVASVTAMSNNATICSFPRLGVNPLPESCSVQEVDALAREVNSGCSVVVPTGVGFCMLITADALEQVGLFDEEAFGRGYGEENDFCLRASFAGYINLLALDVFVAHVGEVSFAEVSKPGKLIAERIILQRYPDYPRRVATFCEEDPGLAARLRLVFAMWRHGGRPVRVLVTHNLGGGTDRHVREQAQLHSADGPVVVLRPVHGHYRRLSVQHLDEYDGFEIEVDDLDETSFTRLLTEMGTRAVDIHHTLGHGSYLRAGLAKANIPFDFVVHDFYTVCPQIVMSTPEGTYCGEPGPSGCNSCIAGRPSHGASDIQNWRHGNEWLAMLAREVRAPSFDAASRLERYFGVKAKVVYHEPQVAHSTGTAKRDASGAPAKVLILGTLAPHKGRRVVLDAAATASRERLPLTFHLIGDPQGSVPKAAGNHFTASGRYDEADLQELIALSGASAVVFPSPIPETYSYTLTAAMQSGLPIVATGIGALPERLSQYSRSMIVPHDIEGPELARVISKYLSDLADNA